MHQQRHVASIRAARQRPEPITFPGVKLQERNPVHQRGFFASVVIAQTFFVCEA
jgi:hypothetical protein